MMRCKVCDGTWYAVVMLDQDRGDGPEIPLCRQHTAEWTTDSDWVVVRTAQSGLNRFRR